MKALSDAGQLSAAWLGRALFEAGHLASADGVAAIELQGGEGARAWSSITRFSVRYRRETSLPSRLLLKICADAAGAFGRSEVDFYTRDYVGLPDAPLVRCLAAAYSETPRRHYHLLLEDLADTHANGDEIQPPDLPFALALADSLAALHAAHWGRVAVPDAAEIERYAGHVLPGLPHLLARSGPEPRLSALMAGLAAGLHARARDPRGMTLLHGDLNPGNLLIPRSRQGPVLLLDRQPFDWSLTRWLGASDLVNAVVCWWDEPVRRALERPLLERYHAGLRRRGVQDYDFAALLADYRLSLAMAAATPVEWCVLESDRERMRPLWEKQLRRALAAVEDFSPA